MGLILRKKLVDFWAKVVKKDEENFANLTFPENIETQTKTYINDNDPMHTLMYVYPSKHQGKLPLIIYVHGGGWYIGTAESNIGFTKTLASYGFGVLCMNYRLLPKSNAKKMVQDIYAAINFAYNDKENTIFDFSNAVIIGDSAGGMLSGLVLGCENSEKIREAYGVQKLPFDIKASCMNHPVPYLRKGELVANHKFMNLIARHEYKVELFGTFFKTFSKVYRYTADFDDILDMVESLPPIFMISSIGDFNYKNMADRVYSDLKRRKFDVKVYINTDEPNCHVYNVLYINSEPAIKTNTLITDFFKDILNK